MHNYTYHVGVKAIVFASSFQHAFTEKLCLAELIQDDVCDQVVEPSPIFIRPPPGLGIPAP